MSDKRSDGASEARPDRSIEESAARTRPRQEHPRVSLQMPVRISTVDAETDPWTGRRYFRTSDETTGNVSRGGVFIATRETIPPGRRVLVELEIPGGERIQTMGRVAWTRTRLSRDARDHDAGIGVEFLGGPAAAGASLERFLARRLDPRPSPTKRASASGPVGTPGAGS